MARAVNVRVESAELHPSADRWERQRAFEKLFKKFKNKVRDSEVLSDARRKEHYESPAEKRRRKQREAESARLKALLPRPVKKEKGDRW